MQAGARQKAIRERELFLSWAFLMPGNSPTILFTEDELILAEIVKESLESRGFRVIHCETGSDTFDLYRRHCPDLIILDIMLPDADGFNLARQIRERDGNTPIIFLTSKSLPQDVVTGFESGGNDYLKKPFSIEELVIRIKALLGKGFARKEESKNSIVAIGKYSFNQPLQKLILEPLVVDLTARETELLTLLLLHRNQMVERKTILKQLWGNDDFFAGRSLDVYITKLRKYLHHDKGVQVVNIRGRGYKLAITSE
jgi:DNA-binding response OmpR family regulator